MPENLGFSTNAIGSVSRDGKRTSSIASKSCEASTWSPIPRRQTESGKVHPVVLEDDDDEMQEDDQVVALVTKIANAGILTSDEYALLQKLASAGDDESDHNDTESDDDAQPMPEGRFKEATTVRRRPIRGGPSVRSPAEVGIHQQPGASGMPGAQFCRP